MYVQYLLPYGSAFIILCSNSVTLPNYILARIFNYFKLLKSYHKIGDTLIDKYIIIYTELPLLK